MYPFRFEPVYQNYVWGGSRIRQKYRPFLTEGKIAESWEISDREEGMSIVAEGPWKGTPLRELVIDLGEKLLGQKRDRFPLLLKIIDAKENLSVQVHPDEKTAALLKGEPKTEMWTFLEEGAAYVGLKKGVNHFIEFKEDLLEKIHFQKGEAIYIPAGSVHAIGAGSLLFEVQQNSNTTYRLYDWERGSRPLHLGEARESIRWDQELAKSTPKIISKEPSHQLITLVNSPFFIVERLELFGTCKMDPDPSTFQILFCTEGEGELSVDAHKAPFYAGLTYLIPANSSSILLSGTCNSLRIRLGSE